MFGRARIQLITTEGSLKSRAQLQSPSYQQVCGQYSHRQVLHPSPGCLQGSKSQLFLAKSFITSYLLRHSEPKAKESQREIASPRRLCLGAEGFFRSQ